LNLVPDQHELNVPAGEPRLEFHEGQLTERDLPVAALALGQEPPAPDPNPIGQELHLAVYAPRLHEQAFRSFRGRGRLPRFSLLPPWEAL
jgi:hypothetical protein